jgi:hypothetical protein
MSLSAYADKIFMEFGRRFDLVAKRTTYEDGEVCVFYDKQVGLDEEVWMCFGNIDEISYGVGDFFSSSAFPCPSAFSWFIENMDGILSGQNRIRYGWFSSVLEEPLEGSWKIIARYSGPNWNGFRWRVFINRPK